MHKTLGAHLAYEQLATQCLSWGGGGGGGINSEPKVLGGTGSKRGHI